MKLITAKAKNRPEIKFITQDESYSEIVKKEIISSYDDEIEITHNEKDKEFYVRQINDDVYVDTYRYTSESIKYISGTEKESSKIRLINMRLNIESPIDRAIFMTICGAYLVRENMAITGVVRLEIAKNILDNTIALINNREEFSELNKKLVSNEIIELGEEDV